MLNILGQSNMKATDIRALVQGITASGLALADLAAMGPKQVLHSFCHLGVIEAGGEWCMKLKRQREGGMQFRGFKNCQFSSPNAISNDKLNLAYYITCKAAWSGVTVLKLSRDGQLEQGPGTGLQRTPFWKGLCQETILRVWWMSVCLFVCLFPLPVFRLGQFQSFCLLCFIRNGIWAMSSGVKQFCFVCVF